MQTPQQLGPYRLVKALGEGGHGTVWIAEDQQQGGRQVALKRLKTDVRFDARLKRRMRREARAVARLEHPNIVRLFDVGEDDEGNPYLVMELIEGVTLRAFFKDDIDFELLLKISDQILAALAFAHSRGVIHRDLKPENILIESLPGGVNVKLLDFGLARVEDDIDDNLTEIARDVFGTPTYMAPEQATGEFAVGPRSDLYAFGIILWEMLCGAPPFSGISSTAVVVQHVTAALPIMAAKPHYDAPIEIFRVLERALAKDPALRFASAGELRRALADFSEDDDQITIVNAGGVFSSSVGMPQLSFPVEDDAAQEEESLETISYAGPLSPEAIPICGREKLQYWLWEEVVAVCEKGRPSVVCLEGGVGAGKTRLGQWLREALAEGGWMYTAGGRYREGVQRSGLREALAELLGFHGPVSVEILAHTLQQMKLEEDPKRLQDALWPAFERPLSKGWTARTFGRLLHAFSARLPILLWLEDLHQATLEELQLLERLYTHLQRHQIPALLLTSRRDDLPQASLSADPITAFLNRKEAKIRALPRLSFSAIAQIVQHSLVCDEDVLAEITRTAHGNPLYAVMALRHLFDTAAMERVGGVYRFKAQAERLPNTLAELAQRQMQVSLSLQGDEAQLWRLLARLALIGERTPFGLLEILYKRCGLPFALLEAQLEVLVRLGLILDEAEDTFSFTYQLNREALLFDLEGRAETAEIHGRIAEAKHAFYTQPTARERGEIAAHHAAAGRLPEAVEGMLEASGLARAIYHLPQAGALLAKADRWLDGVEGVDPLKADVRLTLAQVALDARDSERAERLSRQILDWAQAANARRRLAEGLLICAEARLNVGRWTNVRKLLEAAGELFSGLSRPRGEGLVAFLWGRMAVYRGDLEGAKAAFNEAQDIFKAIDDVPHLAACQRVFGEIALRQGQRAEGGALLKAALDSASARRDLPLIATAALRLGELTRYERRYEEALAYFTQAAEAQELLGNPAAAGRCLKSCGDILRALGRGEATRVYQEALDIFEEQGDQFQIAVCLTQLGRTMEDSHQLESAGLYFERALESLEAFDDPMRVGVLHAFLARVAHRRGDAAARQYHLKEAFYIDNFKPLLAAEWARVLEELAEGAALEGRAEEARRLYARCVDLWQALQSPQDEQRCRAALESH
ncbi:protein kinase [Myxococcota bacterium]|nr:protein kinase [Myxococcota bacterium]MBU1897569.1 protein kinase [Myxococcota bacterium]